MKRPAICATDRRDLHSFFPSPGFCTEIVPFEVAAQGEKEMLVKLQIGNVTQSLKVST